KLGRLGVIGIASKAGQSPSVIVRFSRFGAQSAEGGQMHIANSVQRELPRQHIAVELWIVARARHLSHVGHDADGPCAQEIGELIDAPLRVADRIRGLRAVGWSYCLLHPSPGA